ncbi:MAG: methyltransferase domain-containing protein [bacterium]
MEVRPADHRFRGVFRPAHQAAERLSVMGVLERAYKAVPPFRRAVYRIWYRQMTRLDKQVESPFANYGYAPLDAGAGQPALAAADEPDRLSIQLYHHVAAAVPIAGRDVLEVGSGRGGGASYIARYLGPRSMTGIDLNLRAIECCQRRHCRRATDGGPVEVPNLRFRRGDAENLPFADRSFDAVVNVESSHCYGSMKRFLAEVARVLRPGGWLLFADFRSSAEATKLRRQFEQAGFLVEREERITPNVFRALELDSERKLALIRRRVPAVLQAVFRQFAATSGTPTWEKFRQAHWEYLSYVLRKPA